MKKAFFLCAVTASTLFLVAVMSGCGGNGTTTIPAASHTPTQTPTPTPTPIPTPTPTSTQITDVHLFAFLRTDGTTNGNPAPLSQQQLQAARRTAKIDYAINRETPITADPGSLNIHVWPFGMRQGWLPLAERKITDNPGAYTSVHLSADDTSIVFSAVVNGYNQIFTGTVPPEGQAMGEPIQLTSDMEHHWVPHISSDGSKVVFTKFDATSNGDVVCVINNTGAAMEACLDFSATTPVLKGTNIWHASWTPDGKILFEAWGGLLNSDEIFMVNADGSNLTQITSNAGTRNYDECPSSNGTWIVMDTWNDTTQSYDITSFDANTKVRYTITDGPYAHGDSWDPLATYYTTVWVSQLEDDSYPQIYVDAAFDVVRLSSNTYVNYFENRPR